MNLILPFVNIFLALVMILGQVLVVFTIILFFFHRNKPDHFDRWSGKYLGFIHKYILGIGFIITLGATVFSLFYSDIIGFAPCKLCWIQRVFIYPQVLIFGLALIRKDRKIIDYSVVLTIVGLIFSFYHNYLYFLPTENIPCDASGVSCTANYVNEFGYITIPVMTLTAFMMTLVALLVDRVYKKD